MFAPKYKVHYNKNKSCFSNAKDSYRAGEQVTLIYPFIATDTDYSFSVDGADYKLNYTDEGNDHIILCTVGATLAVARGCFPHKQTFPLYCIACRCILTGASPVTTINF